MYYSNFLLVLVALTSSSNESPRHPCAGTGLMLVSAKRGDSGEKIGRRLGKESTDWPTFTPTTVHHSVPDEHYFVDDSLDHQVVKPQAEETKDVPDEHHSEDVSLDHQVVKPNSEDETPPDSVSVHSEDVTHMSHSEDVPDEHHSEAVSLDQHDETNFPTFMPTTTWKGNSHGWGGGGHAQFDVTDYPTYMPSTSWWGVDGVDDSSSWGSKSGKGGKSSKGSKGSKGSKSGWSSGKSGKRFRRNLRRVKL